MPFKINPFTGKPDFYESGSGGSGESIITPTNFGYADDGIDAGLWYVSHTGANSFSDLSPGNEDLVGVCEMSPGDSGTGSADGMLSNPDTFGLCTIAGSFSCHIHFICSGIQTADDKWVLSVGFLNRGNPDSGMYITYDTVNFNGNWQCVSGSGGHYSIVDSNIPYAEGVYTLRLSYDGISDTDFFFNDGSGEVLMGTTSGNVSNSSLGAGGNIFQSSFTSVSPFLGIDYADFNMNIPGRF